MHLLRTIAIYIIIGFALFISCKSEGALTPEQAFNKLRNAYQNSDAGAVVAILSTGSNNKVKEIIAMIAAMDENQLKSLSERFEVTVDKMKNLSVKDYIALQLSMGEKIGGDILKEITKHEIIGTDKNERTAVVRVGNGMEIVFVKEGKYWKFDMKDL